MESVINSEPMEVVVNLIDSQISSAEAEVIDNQDASVKEATAELPKKYDKEEFAYLKNSGFSSEIYKVEIKNLPKHYGYGEIKKLINTTLGLECNKIKIPWKNSPFGFICFKNDEGL